MAAKIKNDTKIPTWTVGEIRTPEQAEKILLQDQADMIMIARGFLSDPRWVWRAAKLLGDTIDCPPQYQRGFSAL